MKLVLRVHICFKWCEQQGAWCSGWSPLRGHICSAESDHTMPLLSQQLSLWFCPHSETGCLLCTGPLAITPRRRHPATLWSEGLVHAASWGHWAFPGFLLSYLKLFTSKWRFVIQLKTIVLDRVRPLWFSVLGRQKLLYVWRKKCEVFWQKNTWPIVLHGVRVYHSLGLFSQGHRKSCRCRGKFMPWKLMSHSEWRNYRKYVARYNNKVIQIIQNKHQHQPSFTSRLKHVIKIWNGLYHPRHEF